MDAIKDAFQKVKQDIESLKEALSTLTSCMLEVNDKLKEVNEELKTLKAPPKTTETSERIPPSTKLPSPTHDPKISTDMPFIPAHTWLYTAQKGEKQDISTGNEGVPTDRQTDQQTDQQTQSTLKTSQNPIENAAEMLESLDSLKKEIRLKFKQLTEREWVLFSLIYQLDEENKEIDYRILAQKLNLTESSIRDYVGRLIQKGVPLSKTKINNKQIQLSISKNLKKIASLSTILQLRNL